MLNATQDTPVQLICGNVPMYKGQMGRKGNKVAVRIDDRVVKDPKNG